MDIDRDDITTLERAYTLLAGLGAADLAEGMLAVLDELEESDEEEGAADMG